LIESINENFKALKKAKLVAPQALKTIEKLASHEDVLAVKGCGALGADVFCVLVKNEKLPQFISYGRSENLNMVALDGFRMSVKRNGIINEIKYKVV